MIVQPTPKSSLEIAMYRGCGLDGEEVWWGEFVCSFVCFFGRNCLR